MATPIKQALSMGYKFESKILDIENIDVRSLESTHI